MSTKRTLCRALQAFGVFGVVVVGAGCGGSGSTSSALVTVSPAQDLDLTSQPELTGAVVLTISGRGVDDRFVDGLTLDIAALEQLRVVDAAIDDPWEKRSVTYRGVLMSDLIDAVAPAGATTLRLTALDDYEVTISIDDLLDGEVLLATAADGERLRVEDGGPTRIVFLPGSSVGTNQDLWIWNVEEMVAE